MSAPEDTPDQRCPHPDALVGITAGEVEKILANREIFYAYRAPPTDPSEGERLIEWSALAADTDAVRRFVTRLVQTEGLWRLRDQIEPEIRVTYVKRYPRAAESPHIVFDDALARRLGVQPIATVARVVEAVLRLRPRLEEMPALMKFLFENGEYGPTPLPRIECWGIEDVRLSAPCGMVPPANGHAFVAAFSIETDLPHGPTIGFLTGRPVDGAERSRPVTINASLARRLGI